MEIQNRKFRKEITQLSVLKRVYSNQTTRFDELLNRDHLVIRRILTRTIAAKRFRVEK